jgi:hypothetical protein
MDGEGSFDICPCCKFQYAVTDDLKGKTFSSWRRKWIASGAKWPNTPKGNIAPADWNAANQLRNIGIDIEEERKCLLNSTN